MSEDGWEAYSVATDCLLSYTYLWRPHTREKMMFSFSLKTSGHSDKKWLPTFTLHTAQDLVPDANIKEIYGQECTVSPGAVQNTWILILKQESIQYYNNLKLGPH